MTSRPRTLVIHRSLGMAILGLSMLATVSAGCGSQTDAPEAQRGDRLVPGKAVTIDLGGDGKREEVLIEASDRSLTISGDPADYQSRDRWRFIEACLGDTDGDSLPEIVALVDSVDGRHLGLFGFASDGSEGSYRELLVTSVLEPHPTSLRIELAADPQARPPQGDLVMLSEVVQDGAVETLYRWNGFGFTAIGSADPVK